MTSFSRLFVILGIVFLLVGGGLYLLGRMNIPVGRLPGDFRIEGKNFTFYFPLATSILLSIVLTILLNIVVRIFGRR